jgi:hypothetical protein
LKTSARRTLERADAVYLSTIDHSDTAIARRRFEEWRSGLAIDLNIDGLPIFTQFELTQLLECIPLPVQAGGLLTL